MINSRSLDDLRPDVRANVEQLLDEYSNIATMDPAKLPAIRGRTRSKTGKAPFCCAD